MTSNVPDDANGDVPLMSAPPANDIAPGELIAAINASWTRKRRNPPTTISKTNGCQTSHSTR
jgi:hypothetical protein